MDKPIFVCDLGGVLINLNVERCVSCFRELMGEENLRNALGLDDDGEGVKAVSVANRQLMADFERGLISAEDFVIEVQRFCKAGTTREEVTGAWMAMLADLPEDRLDYLHRLRREGYRLYLLSNGNDLHFHYINDRYHLDSCFERMFLSQEMHIAKPEKEIYEQVEAAIRPRTAVEDERQPEVIFVDDLPQNRLAAEQTAGWKTCASLNELKQLLG